MDVIKPSFTSVHSMAFELMKCTSPLRPNFCILNGTTNLFMILKVRTFEISVVGDEVSDACDAFFRDSRVQVYLVQRICAIIVINTIALKMVKVSKLVQKKLIPYTCRSKIGSKTFRKIKYFGYIPRLLFCAFYSA